MSDTWWLGWTSTQDQTRIRLGRQTAVFTSPGSLMQFPPTDVEEEKQCQGVLGNRICQRRPPGKKSASEGRARPPSCWDACVSPDHVLFLGQPHCAFQTVYPEWPREGTTHGHVTRSRSPPPCCPGKATRSFLPRPKVIPSPRPKVIPSPAPRPKNQLDSHHPKMQLIKKQIVDEGIDEVGCYSG